MSFFASWKCFFLQQNDAKPQYITFSVFGTEKKENGLINDNI